MVPDRVAPRGVPRMAAVMRRRMNRSQLTVSSTCGRCTFTATSTSDVPRPPGPGTRIVPRYTWPRLAAAAGYSPRSTNISHQGRPSSLVMTRVASAVGNGGTAQNSCVSSSTLSGLRISGRAASPWPSLTNAGPREVSTRRRCCTCMRSLRFSSPRALSHATDAMNSPLVFTSCTMRAATTSGCLAQKSSWSLALYPKGSFATKSSRISMSSMRSGSGAMPPRRRPMPKPKPPCEGNCSVRMARSTAPDTMGSRRSASTTSINSGGMRGGEEEVEEEDEEDEEEEGGDADGDDRGDAAASTRLPARRAGGAPG
mmetsp:Transcript_9343/g.23306  ORF Transcript_9343/g.23306 Transcript_9343/m.23306 type:complete len:313 (+) Transcript_9343:1128-2066(+)